MITLHPDKITFRGPSMDGGYNVTLHVGEYEKEAISQLVQLPTEQVYSVSFEVPEKEVRADS